MLIVPDPRRQQPFLLRWLRAGDGYVQVRGREEWVALRGARRPSNQKPVARQARRLAALARFPFLHTVALSGACARSAFEARWRRLGLAEEAGP